MLPKYTGKVCRLPTAFFCSWCVEIYREGQRVDAIYGTARESVIADAKAMVGGMRAEESTLHEPEWISFDA